MMLIVNWMQQSIMEPFSFIYVFHTSLSILLIVFTSEVIELSFLALVVYIVRLEAPMKMRG